MLSNSIVNVREYIRNQEVHYFRGFQEQPRPARNVGFIHANEPERLSGGMTGRVYIVRFKDNTIRAWTCEMPGGKLEQFQVAVGN